MNDGFKELFEKTPSLSAGQAEAFLELLAQRFSETEPADRATSASIAPPMPGGNPASDAEAKYRALVEQIPAVIFMAFLDRAISEAYVSPQIETILNYTQDEWLADPIGWYERIHPDDRERLSADAAQLLMFGRPVRSEYRVFARDGRPIWFRCEAKIVRTEEGRPWFLHGVAFDVTELKRAEEALRRLVESAPDAIVIVNSSGRIVRVNALAEEMFGYRREELLGQGLEILVPPRFRGEHPGFRASYFENPRARPMGMGFELRGLRKDGSEFPVEISLNAIDTDEGVLVSSAIRDVTDRERAQQALRDSLSEKETLIREVHHRVKNNLAVISSLFYLESTYATDDHTVRLLREAQARVRSMALVHESLYRSDNVAAVNFGDYTRTLLASLFRTYEVSSDRIRLRSSVEDVVLGVEDAIPCGMIVNELVTNSLKHAFQPDAGGEIVVTVAHSEDGAYVIVVTDDGVGIPPDVDAATSRSLGLRLMRLLTAQLGGTMQIHRTNPGTEARLVFRPHEQK